MTAPHGATAEGVPVDLIGQPLATGRGSVPGLFQQRTDEMTKATHDGTYTLNGGRFHIRAGDPLPEGAVLDEVAVADEAVDEAPVIEQRNQGAAPENRAKAEKAEKR